MLTQTIQRPLSHDVNDHNYQYCTPGPGCQVFTTILARGVDANTTTKPLFVYYDATGASLGALTSTNLDDVDSIDIRVGMDTVSTGPMGTTSITTRVSLPNHESLLRNGSSVMIRSLNRRLRRSSDPDEGAALVMVLDGHHPGEQHRPGRRCLRHVRPDGSRRTTQGWNAALAAAQAGVDDYIARLNANDAYARSWDCTNVALKGPNATGNTCGWTSSTSAGWQPVDDTNPTSPVFHYDVSAATLDSTGVVQVTSTGKAARRQPNPAGRRQPRRVDRLPLLHRPRGRGPRQLVRLPVGHAVVLLELLVDAAQGARHRQHARPAAARRSSSRPATCSTARCTPTTPRCSAQARPRPNFKQGLETSDPACKAAVKGDTNSYKYCDRTQANASYGTVGAYWAATKLLQDTSDQFQNFPGCQFSGSTRIKFNAAGTMTVWSANSTNSAACGGNAPAGVTVPVPTDKVIYVKAGGDPGPVQVGPDR